MFAEDIRAIIQRALDERIRLPRCYLCGRGEWGLVERGLVRLPFVPNPGDAAKDKWDLICVAIECQNCGSTLLLSVNRLGLSGLLPPQ